MLAPDEDEGLAPPGGVLALDPARLSTLLEQGVEALVVAFVETPLVEGGMEAAIPGWEKTTKGLQGQVRFRWSSAGGGGGRWGRVLIFLRFCLP